ncbi:glycoside hydrolase family 9 protein [candidate division KSB1 bacterium]|nr:glycoside hydrolase family 9 protein [candidate division KSB1 bacterium]
MMMKKLTFCAFVFLLLSLSNVQAKLFLKEIRTAADDVLVVFFTSDTLNVNEIDTLDSSLWKINGVSPDSMFKYVTKADPCDHHVYLKASKLEEGKEYNIETPFGNKTFTFFDTEIFCESIKVNQVGYSALSKVRYANFSIWLGTGGGRKIKGTLPGYKVIDNVSEKVVAKGVLKELGNDKSSGGYVYRIDLAAVPEGGPYKIAVDGYGCSYPFGVGGEFSNQLAYTLFRAQYLQRCGCPIHKPDIRKKPCHTLIYDVDGPIGEANIDVVGDERTFKCYGGYHDAGDADRRAYHMSNPIINLMIYEAFPAYFTDGQFDIPGDFDEEYNILNYTNNVPDIIDEAAWGTLVWEYLQNEDGSIHFGTETRRYPDPFAAPLDLDDKKYGTVIIDDRATCTGAGLFMHLARIIKPYDPERSEQLFKRAEKALEFGNQVMAEPERLYYHIQRYLLTQDKTDHEKIKELYKISAGLKDYLYETPGYSLNNDHFDNPAYILSYILAKDVPTDPDVVSFFKQAVKDAADANIAELKSHAYPVGNNPAEGGWGHNVRQPQYACAPVLQWMLSKEQKYLDAASELMDYKVGLNPIGICYITGIGSHQVFNIHDRESAYTIEKGWGPKPGITAFGPGVAGRRSRAPVIPPVNLLNKERQFVDDRNIISFTEFTIFETMHYDALYTILAGGGQWSGKDPFGNK